MDWLTQLGRKVLPPGYWGDAESQTTGCKQVCLTIDDGPEPATTPTLLKLLEAKQVKATFFLIGSKAQRHPQLVEMIAKSGHTIGNHTFNHPVMPLLSTRRIEQEIDQTNGVIEAIIKQPVKLFRAPYGIVEGRAHSCLSERGMQAVYWGTVPEDWTRIGVRSVVNRVMRRLRHGTLIVLHERSSLALQTVESVQEIINQARSTGYEFEDIRQMMEAN